MRHGKNGSLAPDDGDLDEFLALLKKWCGESQVAYLAQVLENRGDFSGWFLQKPWFFRSGNRDLAL